MRLFIVIIGFLFSLQALPQVIVHEVQTDTIQLKPFSSAKVIAYKYSTLTFYLSYDSVKQLFRTLYTKYRDHRPVNRKYRHNWKLALKAMKNDVVQNQTVRDTVILIHETYMAAQIDEIERFLAATIEKGNCAIVDAKGNMQSQIRRQTIRYTAIVAGWYGRQFYLLKNDNYFLRITDLEV